MKKSNALSYIVVPCIILFYSCLSHNHIYASAADFVYPGSEGAIPITILFKKDGELPPFIEGLVPDHRRTRTEMDAYADHSQVLSTLRDLGFGIRIRDTKLDETFDRRSAEDSVDYHDQLSMTAFLQQLQTRYPGLLTLQSIGLSVRGLDIWAAEISSQSPTRRDPAEGGQGSKGVDSIGVGESVGVRGPAKLDSPLADGKTPLEMPLLEFKYVANIHGDETVGRELCLYFIEYLCESYEAGDVRIRRLVNSTRISVIPSLNPDGFELKRRTNARYHDLNRDFDDPLKGGSGFATGLISYANNKKQGESYHQPEVAALTAWSKKHNFVLSATFHGGSVVANYPMDCAPDHRSGTYAASPDDALFRHLARVYADANPEMANSPEFPYGITNGNSWYCLLGGSQDWNYRYTSDMELTLEVSDVKRPHPSTLSSYWERNRESMIAYVEQAHIGINGRILFPESAAAAKIMIDGNYKPCFSDADTGWYHRILLPGTYRITITADGYEPVHLLDVVVNSQTPYETTRLDDVYMKKLLE